MSRFPRQPGTALTTKWVCPACHQPIWGVLAAKTWHLEKHEDR